MPVVVEHERRTIVDAGAGARRSKLDGAAAAGAAAIAVDCCTVVVRRGTAPAVAEPMRHAGLELIPPLAVVPRTRKECRRPLAFGLLRTISPHQAAVVAAAAEEEEEFAHGETGGVDNDDDDDVDWLVLLRRHHHHRVLRGDRLLRKPFVELDVGAVQIAAVAAAGTSFDVIAVDCGVAGDGDGADAGAVVVDAGAG